MLKEIRLSETLGLPPESFARHLRYQEICVNLYHKGESVITVEDISIIKEFDLSKYEDIVKDQASEGLPASDCSTRCCEVCREPFSELSEDLQGELRELFESVKTCAKCCQQKLQEAYERTMVD